MGEVLLKELSRNDLTWMHDCGHRQEIEAGTILIEEGQSIDCLHIVLDGTLAASISSNNQDPLSRSYTAIEGAESSLEIARLSSGEVVGEISLIRMCLATTTITAVEKSSIVSVPLLSLEHRLAQNADFAARFYRAIAILLKDRLHNFIETKVHRKFRSSQSIKDVLLLFSQLNDSDLDWIIANGELQEFAVNTTLIQENGPIDALYILLSGAVSLSRMSSDRNPLARIFATLEATTVAGVEISRLSKGEIIGESQFIDGELPYFTAKIIEHSQVLAISRQKLNVKLQQDLGFASRFYRTLAIVFSDRLQEMLNRMGYSRRIYSSGSSLASNVKYDLELDDHSLGQIYLAGQKFTWMLERCGSIVESGKTSGRDHSF